VKRLGQVVLAGVTAAVVGGCGMSTAVQGKPMAAPGLASASVKPARPSTTPPPTAASPTPASPSTESSPPSAVDTTPPDDAETVVRAYFDAINAHDYQRAWDLGGKNVGQSYAAFAAGFATTDHDVLTIQSVEGNTVTADLAAVQTDGTTRTFHGTYTVTGDAITRFAVRATG
jgi:hypothetical protein